jgi:signal transduction histidine kinase
MKTGTVGGMLWRGVWVTELSLSLFRVLQEALRNAAKHSGVKRFEVRLWGSTGEIQLTISDLGAGFDTETAMKTTGLGLTSMQERLRLVHGELSINSQPRGGTTIHARIPFAPTSDSARAAGREWRTCPHVHKDSWE